MKDFLTPKEISALLGWNLQQAVMWLARLERRQPALVVRNLRGRRRLAVRVLLRQHPEFWDSFIGDNVTAGMVV